MHSTYTQEEIKNLLNLNSQQAKLFVPRDNKSALELHDIIVMLHEQPDHSAPSLWLEFVLHKLSETEAKHYLEYLPQLVKKTTSTPKLGDSIDLRVAVVMAKYVTLSPFVIRCLPETKKRSLFLTRQLHSSNFQYLNTECLSVLPYQIIDIDFLFDIMAPALAHMNIDLIYQIIDKAVQSYNKQGAHPIKYSNTLIEKDILDHAIHATYISTDNLKTILTGKNLSRWNSSQVLTILSSALYTIENDDDLQDFHTILKSVIRNHGIVINTIANCPLSQQLLMDYILEHHDELFDDTQPASPARSISSSGQKVQFHWQASKTIPSWKDWYNTQVNPDNVNTTVDSYQELLDELQKIKYPSLQRMLNRRISCTNNDIQTINVHNIDCTYIDGDMIPSDLRDRLSNAQLYQMASNPSTSYLMPGGKYISFILDHLYRNPDSLLTGISSHARLSTRDLPQWHIEYQLSEGACRVLQLLKDTHSLAELPMTFSTTRKSFIHRYYSANDYLYLTVRILEDAYNAQGYNPAVTDFTPDNIINYILTRPCKASTYTNTHFIYALNQTDICDVINLNYYYRQQVAIMPCLNAEKLSKIQGTSYYPIIKTTQDVITSIANNPSIYIQREFIETNQLSFVLTYTLMHKFYAKHYGDHPILNSKKLTSIIIPMISFASSLYSYCAQCLNNAQVAIKNYFSPPPVTKHDKKDHVSSAGLHSDASVVSDCQRGTGGSAPEPNNKP